ncbi:hypothetical protein LXM50_08945 [Microbacterium sp. Au-Mic1]|uniref:hypothetical protein n=1 Tax=Microbacterium sp. Au-Mic1 TaxID=2906457 RepID=UPI001E2CC543|nr:hypothetical protein [Microbacterium sp. Au-Mic1]MCE4026099.1 hypothetical protein [Microbacterium sp. Au-Mic1]
MTLVGSEVEITHGGIVAVDPDDLRAMAGRIRADAAAVQVAREELLEIPAILQSSSLPPGSRYVATTPVWTVANRLDEVGEVLDEIASGTATMADIFEIAELRAQREMSGVTDPELVKRSLHRIEAILGRNPRLGEMQRELLKTWAAGAYEGFTPVPGAPLSEASGAAWDIASTLTPALRLALLNAGVGEGEIAQGALLLLMLVAPRFGQTSRSPLTPTPGVVVVDGASGPGAPGRGAVDPRPGDLLLSRTRTPGSVSSGSGTAGATSGALPVPSAPATLSDAVARIPYGQAPQVRVERYTLADGSPRFVAYVDGTRPGQPASEPWDMDSNVQAYVERKESDSYKATVAALRAAGADETTPVDLVGYSQGGMNVDLVAQSGNFDVQGVYTVGSPTEPALPAEVGHVAVRHTDDPVAGLAGGGRPDGLGSSQGLVITRTAAPGHGIDATMPAHQLSEYQETVRLAEQSGDPRMGGVRAHFSVYEGAALTESTDFTATRIPGSE